MKDLDKAIKEAHDFADKAMETSIPWLKRKALQISNGQLIMAVIVYLLALAFQVRLPPARVLAWFTRDRNEPLLIGI